MNPYLPTPSGSATDWRDQALCRETDPELFFPEGDHPIITARKAKSICQRCPVQFECLEYALETDQRFGIWGGLTERERRPLHWAARKVDQCRNGHKWTPESVYVDPKGVRRCRICANATNRRVRQRRREARYGA